MGDAGLTMAGSGGDRALMKTQSPWKDGCGRDTAGEGLYVCRCLLIKPFIHRTPDTGAVKGMRVAASHAQAAAGCDVIPAAAARRVAVTDARLASGCVLVLTWRYFSH